MKEPKEFHVLIEKVIKVTLDMDKYRGETLQQYIDYNGYDNDDLEDVIEETVECLAFQHINNNGCDINIEGYPKEGHVTRHVNTYCRVLDDYLG